MIMLNLVMIVVLLSAKILSIVMLSVIVLCYVSFKSCKCHFADYQCAECLYDEYD